MSHPVKLLHISDLHNEPDSEDRLSYIQEHYPKHHLIVTGDITDDGRVDQYLWTACFRDMSRFCVPGNHDVAEAGNFDQLRRLRRFDAAFGTSFSHSKAVQVDILDDRVALIGLNSNPGTWGFWLDFARGKIGRKQRSSLDEALSRLKGLTRVVYLHHHPFWHHILLELSDAKELMAILKGNCEVLLFGHKHVQHRYYNAEWYYKIEVIHGAGALYKESEALEMTICNGEITTQYLPVTQ